MENERKSSQLDSLVEDKINMHVKSANNLLALCNHLIRSIDEIITRITSQKDNQHSPKSNEARGLNGKPTNLILSYSFSLSLSHSHSHFDLLSRDVITKVPTISMRHCHH